MPIQRPNTMTLLWLYALANHSALSWLPDAVRLTLHTEFVIIALDGV